MSYNDLMSKVRYWDTLAAKWLMRHFYVMFFQIVLVMIFVIWFINLFNVIDTSMQVRQQDVSLRIAAAQSVNISIIVFLILLNSFWLLFMFNSIHNLRAILKDIGYHISKLRIIKDRSSPPA